MAYREIRDDSARKWSLWDVRPTTVWDGELLAAIVASPLRSGWLAFQSGMETRRIAPAPTGWPTMTDEQLRALLAQAEVIVSARKDPTG